MAITDRYASAVHSSSLKTKADTVMGDTDVLGAMGIADRVLTTGRDHDRNVHPAPLAVPLARLFSGDNRAAYEIVRTLAGMAFDQSWVMHIKIGQAQAKDMAKACLAWYRDGVCKPCGGHGETLIPGSKTHSGHNCQACRGTGKIPFESQFRQEHQQLARWLVAEMERECGRAGPIAMAKIAPTLEL